MTAPQPRSPLRALAVATASAAAALALLTGSPAHADDLPSPDAMWLGGRIVPRALVEGFRDGIVDAALDARVALADRPALRARARTAMAPVLDEAFPPELLAGLGASFLARHYGADELRALRAREESPAGERLRAYEKAAADVQGATPEARDEAREALSRRMFDARDRAEIEAFAASPLGRKGLELAPDLAAFFVDQLDRRWAAVRTGIEPRLRKLADGLVEKARR
jgi:hypothetical protein